MPTTFKSLGSRLPSFGPNRWSSWYLIGLKLAMGLLLVLLIVLYFLLRQNEAEEQRSTLIADVLWLEQSISFHIERNAEQLEQLAADLAPERHKKALFELRAQYLLKSNPDIQRIVWIDATGRQLMSNPARLVTRGVPAGSPEEFSKQSMDMAAKLGKTLYTDAYLTSEGGRFNVYTPIFENGRFQGALLSVYAFDSLLKQLVPWWFAEKYQVRILDGNGNALAGKSKIGEVTTPINYALPLERPGFGMVLRVDAYPDRGDFAQRVLIGLVIALVAAVLASLWGMRKHILRRVAAEQALRAAHAFRKAMEDSLTIGMRARDLDGRITYVNPAFCQMVGFGEEELLNARPPLPFWPPEDLERIQAVSQAFVTERDQREGFEVRYMRKDGARFDVLIYEAPLIDADGRHTGWMSSIIDITERKRSEELARQQQEKLQQTSRLVTMGEMASSLAHELNQPLAAITSYNTGCLNKLAADDFSKEELQTAMEKLGVQARRAGHIIRRVHDFVRKSEPKLAPCNLVEIVEDSIGFIEADAKLHDVRIVRKISDISVTLYADRVMLEQVLLNLMRNAIDAMSVDTPPERRRMTIRLSIVDDQVRIRVADRGTGISPAIREKLFTPFFSTKQEGMGMGLNICRSIIEFHRGRLWVEDNLKGGTIFSISLPVAQQ